MRPRPNLATTLGCRGKLGLATLIGSLVEALTVPARVLIAAAIRRSYSLHVTGTAIY